MEERGIRILTYLSRFEGTDPFEFLSYVKAGGKRVPVFKVLYTNYCERNCLYCANRRDRNVKRYSFTPECLAKTFYELYRKNLVQGIFISSGIHHNAKRTMEKMLDTAHILREKFNYRGFIHLKLLPGIDSLSIEEAVRIADRVSINLEAPSKDKLQKIAHEKDFEKELFLPLEQAHRIRTKIGKRTGLCTQFVVGASGENDRDIIEKSFLLTRTLRLQRVYYSAFYPVPNTPLEGHPKASEKRELRLYQAFYLMKNYGVKPQEFLLDSGGYLKENVDPKEGIFLKRYGGNPVEINTAPLEKLTLIPGIGPETAKRIYEMRKVKRIKTPDELVKIGVKRKALKYLLLDGRFYETKIFLFP